jgi:hypothetical protein
MTIGHGVKCLEDDEEERMHFKTNLVKTNSKFNGNYNTKHGEFVKFRT